MKPFTLHITLYDLFFFGMIFIGLNFALLLAFVKSINRTANRFLALALLVMILWMMRILAIDIRLETYLPGWDRLPTQFLLALGPLIYFYVLKITRREHRFRRKDLLHFSPLLLEQATLVCEIEESTRTGAATYVTTAYQLLNPVLQLLIFISIITYLYQSHKLINNFYRRLQPVLMDRSLLEFRWLRNLLAATALLWLSWIAYDAVDYFGYGNQFGIHVYCPFYIFFTVIIIWTATAAFLKPQAQLMIQPPAASMPSVELKEKGNRLKKAMEANRYYQDPELSVSSLAAELDLPSHELSRIINLAFKKNFSDFVNEYRVREVARKMQDPAYDHITLLGIAYESGFSAQSSFSRIFRQLTGKSPLEYKNYLKKERSFYNLRSHAQISRLVLRSETTTQWSQGKINRNYMFHNYLKIAWRHLMKNKRFSFINISGLSIGLTSCMLISIYIFNEISYDTYHQHINSLYQLGTTFIKEGKADRTSSTPAPMAAAMKQEFPEIQETARLMALFTDDKTLIQYKEAQAEVKSFYETKGFIADAAFFKLFTYNFIEGNPASALTEPNTIVLSEEIAAKIFGGQPALNKIIHVNSNTNGEADFKVTGVFRPVNKPSQINARFFLSVMGGDIERFMRQQTDMVGNNMFSTFLLLKPGADAKKLEAKFPAFVDKYLGTGLKHAGFYKKQFLLPVRDIHLYAGMPNDISPVGSVTYLYILASIALFTLLIACINFMNLATARSSKRSVEVGIRKTLGAGRSSLVKQFLGESLLMSLLAFLFALGLTGLLISSFSAVSGKNLTFSPSEAWPIITSFFVLSVFTGLLAGSYPAFYLSSFQPVKVLKGRLTNSLSVAALRKVLVVSQFVISVVLIIASVVILNQMTYMRSVDLGFAKDQQIVIPLRSTAAKNIYASLKNEIKNNSKVQNVSAALYYPGIVNPSDMGLYKEGKTVNDATTVHTNWVDDSFLQTLDIKLLAGRLFSKEFPSDTSGTIIINEEAVKKLGFSSAQEAIGKKVKFDWRGETSAWSVIGVVKNFHFQDLHVAIEPYGFLLNNVPQYNYLVVHAKAADIGSLMQSIGASWHKLDSAEPFEYSFLDEDFQKNYDAESRLSTIVSYFTVVAIVISCLGLLGLAIFSAEQRVKEIGVRKVMGASVAGIVALLSKDFLKLIVIAVVIASPIAWLIMHKWLQGFAYRTGISWTVFAVTAFAAVSVALLTISFQAIKAAIANPVKSLRTE